MCDLINIDIRRIKRFLNEYVRKRTLQIDGSVSVLPKEQEHWMAAWEAVEIGRVRFRDFPEIRRKVWLQTSLHPLGVFGKPHMYPYRPFMKHRWTIGGRR